MTHNPDVPSPHERHMDPALMGRCCDAINVLIARGQLTWDHEYDFRYENGRWWVRIWRAAQGDPDGRPDQDGFRYVDPAELIVSAGGEQFLAEIYGPR